MQINIIYDASVANAPAGFQAAVQAAVQYLEQAFDTPITVNIDVGWGEVGGQTMPAGAIGASTASNVELSYNDLRAALWRDGTDTAALAAALALPAADPTNGGAFVMSTAEAKALGLLDPTGVQVDGSIGLDPTTSFTFDPNNRAQSGLVDAIGVIEHEITEVLGRVSWNGQVLGGATLFGPIDLFRYASEGVLAPGGASGFFSYDGQNLLLPFNNAVNGGDSGDWAQSVLGDAFNAFAATDTLLQVSSTDLTLMDVLGYHPAVVMPATPTPNVSQSSEVITNSQALSNGQGQTFFLTSSAEVVGYELDAKNPNGPNPSFTNSGTLVVTSTAGNAVGLAEYFQGGGFGPAPVTNAAGASWYVESSGSNTDAIGFYAPTIAGSDFVNSGTLQAVATDGPAFGLVLDGAGNYAANQGDQFHFTQTGSGTITAWGRTPAIGVDMASADGGGAADIFSNAGLISATGGTGITDISPFTPVSIGVITAVGVELYSLNQNASFSNAGTIQALNVAVGAVSVGVEFGGVGDLQPPGVLNNSGTIEGDFSIYETAVVGPVDGFLNLLPATFFTASIINSGRLIGDVNLQPGVVTIQNTGTIAGDVEFGDGTATYNGAGGHLYGAIFLGLGANTVTLGPDGNTVFGGGLDDTITGGAGNDVFVIPRGNNSIDGGGGSNTLSFQDADTGVTVNMASGQATGAGLTAFKNIQEVIGSSFNDTMIAGASAVTFIAGTGTDVLTGGAGNDTMVAGAGGDTMTGGGGNNSFVYSAGDQQLVITDFRQGGDQDTLNIYGYAEAQSVQQQGSDTLITLSGGDSVLLKGVQASSLTSSEVSYHKDAYIGAPLPGSVPVFSSGYLFLDQDFTFFKGEVFAPTSLYFDQFVGGTGGINAWYGILDDSNLTGQAAQLQNFGTIDISLADPHDYVVGIAMLRTSQTFHNSTIVNEAGGVIEVSNPDGWAQGIYPENGGDSNDPGFINAGMFGVAGKLRSIGIESWSVPDGHNQQEPVDNQATGSLSVTSTTEDAQAIFLHNGGDVTNEGTIIASGGNLSNAVSYTAGIRIDRFEGTSTIVNSGQITAQAAGGAVAYGITVDGLDNGSFVPMTIVNSGTITAPVAIRSFSNEFSPPNAPSLVISNSGTINGDIDLDGTFNTLTNTGQINGNIVLTEDEANPGGVMGDTIDLRRGSLNGFVSIAPGFGGGSLAMADVIDTGAAATLIKVAGGESPLTLAVNGQAGGQTTVQLDIASSAATWAQSPNGTWTVHGGTDGTLTLSNVQTLQFTDKTVMLATTPIVDDFNVDNKSDFLIQNAAGVVVTGEDVGGAPAYAAVTDLGSEWQFRGNGDFLGDAKEAFLIQNTAGAVFVSEVSGGSVSFSQVAALGSEWSFKGAGDLLGDAKDQFLIENSSGVVVVGEVQSGAAVYTAVSALGPEWSFHGVADFNGDGQDDYLIQNTAGVVAIGEVKNGSAVYAAVTDLGSEWKFVGTGDFLGDGKSDFLIQNTAGQVDFGEVVGGGTTFTAVTQLGPEWKFVAAGDYLGEGHDQFLIENSSGAVVIGDWTGGAIHFTQVAALGPEWVFH